MIIPNKNFNHYSVSSVKLFMECNYKFVFSYLFDLKPDNVYLRTGSLVHSVLEECYKNNIYNSDKMVEMAKEKAINDIDIKKANSIIEDSLNNFDYNKIWRDNMECEVKFSIDRGKYNFVGVMDLLYKDETNKTALIFDYKTNQRFNLEDHIVQASAYTHVFEELNNMAAFFSLYMLRENKIIYIKPLEKEYFWKMIDNIVERVNAKDFVPNTYVCNKYTGCDYKNRCPYYKGKK